MLRERPCFVLARDLRPWAELRHPRDRPELGIRVDRPHSHTWLELECLGSAGGGWWQSEVLQNPPRASLSVCEFV